MTSSTGNDAWIRQFAANARRASAPSSGRQEPGTVRLVCFPHAGGSATFFFPLHESMDPDVEVLAVQYPGRQDRRSEKPIETITEMADQVVTALEPWTDRPLAFFGHSMGAVVAYEVARRLERAGIQLAAFFPSGRRAPSRQRDNAPVYRRDDDGVIAELRRLSGTDTALLGDEELLRMILPAIRSDYRAIETYPRQDGPGLSCPVTALTGDADPEVTLDEAQAWREHTTGEFSMLVFPGGHFFLVSERARVTEAILERLRVHA